MMNKNTKQVRSLVQELHNVGQPKISLKMVNSTLEDMITRLKALEHLPFNSELPHDFVSCYRSLLIHRATGKYVVPANRKSCREAAFATYKDYEERLTTVGPCQTYGHEYGQPIKKLMDSIFHDFNWKQILRDAPIRFSPGETFISMAGETSIDAKLTERKHWTVSASSVDDAVYLIYHCRGLKTAAKEFFPSFDPSTKKKQRARLFSRFKGQKDIGFKVFRYLLIKHVFTIVDGARAETVPKNAETDRFINIEPFFDMLLQACLEWYLRRKLRHYGNDLGYKGPIKPSTNWYIQDTQHLHGLLLKDPDLCTIDLKNASDSTLVSRLALLPPFVSGVILRSRSMCVTFPDGDIIYPEKVSSMGNGFTFGLMTFLIYFSLLANNVSSNVFGDDIIVHKKDVSRTIEILSYLGYNLNLTKTFIEHPFRESCGYFHYIGKGYIRSFDIVRCENITDAIVVTNKIYLLWQDCVSERQWDMADVFEDMYKKLLGLFHASQKGPTPCGLFMQGTNLALYVYDPGFLKKQKQSTEHSTLYKKGVKLMDLLGLEISDSYFVAVPYFQPKVSSYKPTRRVKNLLNMSGYGAGKVRGEGRWKSELCLVTTTGAVYRFGQLSQIWTSTIEDLVPTISKRPISV